MSRLSKTLRALGSLARNPWLLNHVLAADTDAWQRQALRHAARWQVGEYGLPETPLTNLLPPGGDTVHPFAFGGGGSLPTDLLLLRALARQKPGASYFEIGTWRGESAAAVADVAATVHTLNLSADELRQMGMAQAYIDLHGHFSRPLPNVTHLHGNSATFNFGGLGPFDVVFIDGDHRYEAVRRDTERVFAELLHPQSVVVWHDAAQQPGQPRWEVLTGLLDGIPATAAGQLYAVQNTLCALYSPTPLPAQVHQPHAAPNPAFAVHVQPLR
ncbi:class I SAM-dependent methyltransferase [Hymenobacter busanensis]|uniref:class I SAM-dependent methyltransferase n=1 Tax=Hymenobacter busanensis TaxID=2607656 RepID=UPI001366D7A1|nr:class I SAM-dependent methyltransferase [Hymenobacter busanensis]QHJ07815.1 class I SAM-dependent methyltransferase [Hymenobacter busanensis]